MHNFSIEIHTKWLSNLIRERIYLPVGRRVNPLRHYIGKFFSLTVGESLRKADIIDNADYASGICWHYENLHIARRLSGLSRREMRTCIARAM